MGHTSPISRCRFSVSGDNIASASVDGTVRYLLCKLITYRNYKEIICPDKIFGIDCLNERHFGSLGPSVLREPLSYHVLVHAALKDPTVCLTVLPQRYCPWLSNNFGLLEFNIFKLPRLSDILVPWSITFCQ